MMYYTNVQRQVASQRDTKQDTLVAKGTVGLTVYFLGLLACLQKSRGDPWLSSDPVSILSLYPHWCSQGGGRS